METKRTPNEERAPGKFDTGLSEVKRDKGKKCLTYVMSLYVNSWVHRTGMRKYSKKIKFTKDKNYSYTPITSNC